MSVVVSGRAGARARIIILVLIAALAAAVLAPGPSDAGASTEASIAKKKSKKKAKRKPPAPIKVMTRNLYLGASLGPALDAPSLAAAIKGAGQIYREVERTNFPERAVPLGREILKAKPDLVGLQEVALWRVQNPSDGGWEETGGAFGSQPATDVNYDFLALLMQQIGGQYRVVASQNEFDAELPADIDDDTATGTGPLGFMGADLDARLTMRDVILVRKGSKVKPKAATVKMGHYENLFSAELAGGAATVTAVRGWLSVEAKVKRTKKRKGAKFRFVNTHLEAFGDPKIREAQAKEMFAEGGPLRSKGQVILVGDLNSGLKHPHNIGEGGGGSGNPDDELAFKALKEFGMKDKGAVQSCCYPAAMDDPSFLFTHTVDHVLVKPNIKRLKAFVTGNDVGEMTPSGLWPSDHGGVVSKLKLKK